MEHVPELTPYLPLSTSDEPVGLRPQPRYLRVRRSRSGPGVAVCTAVGEVDMGTAALFEGAVRDAGQDAATALVVDLSQVRFLAVAGVRVLHGAAARAAATGRWFALVVNTYPVCRSLELCDNGRLRTRYRRLSEALLVARRPSEWC